MKNPRITGNAGLDFWRWFGMGTVIGTVIGPVSNNIVQGTACAWTGGVIPW